MKSGKSTGIKIFHQNGCHRKERGRRQDHQLILSSPIHLHIYLEIRNSRRLFHL